MGLGSLGPRLAGCMALAAWPIVSPQHSVAQVQSVESRGGNLIVSGAWSRATPPGSTVGVVYFSITNKGSKADRLVALRAPVASRVEFHETRTVNGVVQMKPVDSVECPPGATVLASPNGLHVMLLGLTRPLAAGTSFSVTLRFRDQGLIFNVPVTVIAAGELTQ
jgi:periplasmic copper chaperone A